MENKEKQLEGYAIYDIENKCYLDNYFDYCEEGENPYIYNNIENVENEIEDHDEPFNYEIHKIKVIFKVEEIYKRNVVYIKTTEE